MDGMERIICRLQADAQAEIDLLLETARETAAQITAQSRSRVEETRAELLRRSEAAAAEQEEQLVGLARMEMRRKVLAVRQELVEQACSMAVEKLCAVPEQQSVQIVAALLRAAAPELPGEALFPQGSPRQIGEQAVALANQTRPAPVKLSHRTCAIRGGFLLDCGQVEVDGSFETLVRLLRAEMAPSVAKLLFPEMAEGSGW